MKVSFKLFVLWCSINLLYLPACKSTRNKPEEVQSIQQPQPLTEPGTDTLKTYLDQERARRKKIKN